jgi:hypothetical protein
MIVDQRHQLKRSIVLDNLSRPEWYSPDDGTFDNAPYAPKIVFVEIISLARELVWMEEAE